MVSDQLKELRKNVLKMTQTAFGEGLGVSISVIKNLEYGITTPNEIFINHLCSVYNVNRQWLETGIGNPLLPSAIGYLDEIARANNLSPLERGIVDGYIRLPPDDRKHVIECMRQLLAAADSAESNAVASAAESAAVRCETDGPELSESS